MGGSMQNHRDNWSSKITFVFAAAGSAVGLGNLWRFSYEAGNNGGGLFVLIYLIAIVFVASPVLLAELCMGRHTSKDAIGSFISIKPGTKFRYIGHMGYIAAIMILSFYSAIAGVSVGYLYKAISGEFSILSQTESVETLVKQSQNMYNALAADHLSMSILIVIFMLMTVYIVSKGIAGGIEKFTKIFMPILFVILGIMIIRSLTLPNASDGVAFYLQPKISSLNIDLVISAIGQAFFSLSLGMGTMITYGSYLSKKENLPQSAGMIALFDTSIAVLAGFMVFPVLFSLGMSPEQGAGGMFVVLPILFSKIPLGQIFAILFFGLLAIAALTSTISLLEVPVAIMVDNRNWNRKKASWMLGAVTLLFAIPAAIFEDFFSLWNQIWGTVALTVGGLLISIFVGWVWKPENALREMDPNSKLLKIGRIWAFLIKYFIPVLILIILISSVINLF